MFTWASSNDVKFFGRNSFWLTKIECIEWVWLLLSWKAFQLLNNRVFHIERHLIVKLDIIFKNQFSALITPSYFRSETWAVAVSCYFFPSKNYVSTPCTSSKKFRFCLLFHLLSPWLWRESGARQNQRLCYSLSSKTQLYFANPRKSFDKKFSSCLKLLLIDLMKVRKMLEKGRSRMGTVEGYGDIHFILEVPTHLSYYTMFGTT